MKAKAVIPALILAVFPVMATAAPAPAHCGPGAVIFNGTVKADNHGLHQVVHAENRFFWACETPMRIHVVITEGGKDAHK